MSGKTLTALALASVLSTASAGNLMSRRKTTACGTFKGCYLRNLVTGHEIKLTGLDTYRIENGDHFSILCEVDGVTDSFIYKYDGKEHTEFEAPLWMNGDNNDSGSHHIVPVDYLSQCSGTKEVRVIGEVFDKVVCFDATYHLDPYCADQKKPARAEEESSSSSGSSSGKSGKGKGGSSSGKSGKGKSGSSSSGKGKSGGSSSGKGKSGGSSSGKGKGGSSSGKSGKGKGGSSSGKSGKGKGGSSSGKSGKSGSSSSGKGKSGKSGSSSRRL